MTPQTMNLLLVPVLWSDTPANPYDWNSLPPLGNYTRDWQTNAND
jgi:hypothetical protein